MAKKSMKNKQRGSPSTKNGKNKKSKAKRMVASVGRGVARAAVDGLMMSPCAAKYALAIANPWAPAAAGACVPSKPARPSQKVTAFARFDVVAPAGQVGYAVFMPTLANNLTFCRYTDGAARPVPNTLQVDAGIAGLSSVQLANLPYTSADLIDNGSAGDIPDVAGRIVSFGVTAQYIGTELNRGGMTYCFVDPAHENLANRTVAEILARAEAEVNVPGSNRNKCCMQISAISATELQYPDIAGAASNVTANIMACFPFSGANELSAATPTLGASPLVFIFTNPTSGTTTYHIEVVVHAEYVGILTEGKTTQNSIDETGLSRVMAAADRAQSKKVSKPGVPFGRVFRECLNEVAQEAGTAALMAGKAMLMSALV
jgi:hypothetical protein